MISPIFIENYVYIFIPSNIYIKSILLLLSYDLYTILYYNKSKFYDHKFVHKNFIQNIYIVITKVNLILLLKIETFTSWRIFYIIKLLSLFFG